jgi:hypothetical protein
MLKFQYILFFVINTQFVFTQLDSNYFKIIPIANVNNKIEIESHSNEILELKNCVLNDSKSNLLVKWKIKKLNGTEYFSEFKQSYVVYKFDSIDKNIAGINSIIFEHNSFHKEVPKEFLALIKIPFFCIYSSIKVYSSLKRERIYIGFKNELNTIVFVLNSNGFIGYIEINNDK